MSDEWARITGPHKSKAFSRYEVVTSGYVLSGHKTKLAAQVSKRRLQRRFPNRRLALGVLARRNYRPFNI
jgi:hypothetical protein